MKILPSFAPGEVGIRGPKARIEVKKDELWRALHPHAKQSPGHNCGMDSSYKAIGRAKCRTFLGKMHFATAAGLSPLQSLGSHFPSPPRLLFGRQVW